MILEQIARAAIAEMNGEKRVRAALQQEKYEAIWAVGKAGVAMARGAAHLQARRRLIITKEGCGGGSPVGFEVLEAAHPIPDQRGVDASSRLLAEAADLAGDARALLLLSGGASALLAVPLKPITLAMVQAATRVLLHGGAPIGDINTVRRHLGAALGGRLAAATPARLDVLAISDVLDDDLSAIGSGPAAADPTTLAQAIEIAQRYRLPGEVVEALRLLPETAKPGDAIFARVQTQLVASPRQFLDAAVAQARARGFQPRCHNNLISGAVETFADELATLAPSLGNGEVLVAAGEPTVKVTGNGRGGRASHLALLVAEKCSRIGGEFAFVACASDGSDGNTPAAGAFVDSSTWAESQKRGLDPGRAVAQFDSYSVLSALDRSIVTGPTGTNVTDLFLVSHV